MNHTLSQLVANVPEPVEAVVLFGSNARGDADFRSDIDVAIFAHANLPSDLAEVKHGLSLAIEPSTPINLSVYSIATAEVMANDGSLFLWHLKSESKPLFLRNSWYAALLRQLVPYSVTKACKDLDTFGAAIHDIRVSLRMANSPLLFEASTMHSILRSLGMITSMVDGKPTFRRDEPIRYIRNVMGKRFRITDPQLGELLLARHIYARNIPQPIELDMEECRWIANEIFEMFAFLRDYAKQSVH